MKRNVVEIRSFAKAIKALIAKHKVLGDDYEAFKKNLAENPEFGDLVSGTGGIRKTRLKSATKGKRGGFRVCYFDDEFEEELFLILIYQKNEKEDLTPDDKKNLREIIKLIRER